MTEVKMPIAYSVTLYTLLEKMLFVNNVVSQGGETPEERELPFNVKYKLHRNFDILLKDFSYFENNRNTLIRQYGEEKDGRITVKPENIEEYREELLKAINIEVTHTFIKLTPEEVALISQNINVTTEEMNLFISFLVEDDNFIKDLQTEVGAEKKEVAEEETAEAMEETDKE
jgi:hypothetical protein